MASRPEIFPVQDGCEPRAGGHAPAVSLACVRWQDMAEDILAWDALAACAAEANPFFESWYLLPALRAHDSDGSVRIIRLEVDGLLAGLLPITRSLRYYTRPIPHISTWLHGNCFLGSPLVARGCEGLFWRELLTWADRHAGIGLFLHIAEMPLDSAIFRALREVLAQQGRHGALVKRDDRAMLKSDASPQAYFEASLSGKKRKELRRQLARLGELGHTAFERQRDAQDIGRWIEEFLTLESAGWKGRAGTALAASESTSSLFRDSLRGAAAQGKLERLTLRLNGQPIAMLATFLTPPGAYSFKTAFDESYARFSPGVLLQRENLAILDDPDIAWSDSCAAADHPMIDHIWRERRAIGRVSIAIGGRLRRAAFRRLARIEIARAPGGMEL